MLIPIGMKSSENTSILFWSITKTLDNEVFSDIRSRNNILGEVSVLDNVHNDDQLVRLSSLKE